jgi:endonuclease-3
MKKKKQINQELIDIHRLFPSTQTELNRTTSFQLLVAVILSAQSTDKQVNKVT